MKTKKSGLFMISFAALFLAMMFPLHALAVTVNYYHGTSYDGSKEEAEEFERILRSEGYVCVTRACSDNPSWTSTLMNNATIMDNVGTYLEDDGEDYRFFVSEFDYQQFSEGKITEIKFLANCYCVSYYIFNHSDEYGNTAGLVGDEAEAAGPVGWVTVYLNVDDALMAQPNLIYSIILEGYDGLFYDLSSANFVNNGYVMRYKLPVGNYRISSVFADNDHVADMSSNAYEDKFRIQSGTNHDIVITFNPIEGDPELLSGEKDTYEVGESPDGKTLMEDGMVITPVAEEKQQINPLIIRIVIWGVLLLMVIIVTCVIRKKLRERENEID